MKATCLICCLYLVVIGLNFGVFALFSFDLLFFLAFRSALLYRCLLALAGVAALWLVFWLIAFRPFDNLR